MVLNIFLFKTDFLGKGSSLALEQAIEIATCMGTAPEQCALIQKQFKLDTKDSKVPAKDCYRCLGKHDPILAISKTKSAFIAKELGTC